MSEEAFQPKNEYEIAAGIRDGHLASPVHLPNYSLFDMRITGTGAAYRLGKDEHTWRDPSLYLTDDFLKRCNGLAVIWEHPERGGLNSDEFNNRIVGMICLPYIKNDEVWGIAKIYDAATIEILSNVKLSTSPMVILGDDSQNRTLTFDGDGKLLIEGEPPFLDHLAICPEGVWDKMDGPSGISATHQEQDDMADKELGQEAEKETKERASEERKEKSDAMPSWAADAFKALGDSLMDAVGKRMDSFEAKWGSGKSDAMKKDSEKETEEEKKKREEEEKADKMKADAAEKEKADKAKADEAKARLDAIEEKMKAAERSDEEAAEMADAQARCDSVAAAFGRVARPAMPGEKGVDYRRRLVSDYKAHSPRWKNVDLAALPAAVLANAEADIYADALKAASKPGVLPAGTLREVKKPRAGGAGFMTEFIGDPDAWMMSFKPPIKSQVAQGGLGIKQRGA